MLYIIGNALGNVQSKVVLHKPRKVISGTFATPKLHRKNRLHVGKTPFMKQYTTGCTLSFQLPHWSYLPSEPLLYFEELHAFEKCVPYSQMLNEIAD